jgi:hypothetical protein
VIESAACSRRETPLDLLLVPAVRQLRFGLLCGVASGPLVPGISRKVTVVHPSPAKAEPHDGPRPPYSDAFGELHPEPCNGMRS